ncbi:MAG: zinc ribbon domain-containing protein [Alphaproteobacteria bacterium]|nr:zinc ribbon domain-containing protein [Alphaproteobacteria bacterium]
MAFLIFCSLIWLASGIASAIVMSNKGHSGCAGFALGFLLGPIGLVIALILQPNSAVLERNDLHSGLHKRCPYCAETIRAEATKCRHCGTLLQRPLDSELANQLQFSKAELDLYSEKQLTTLEDVVATGDAASQSSVCAAICKKIGRPPFQGPPSDFLAAYRDQLRRHLQDSAF